MPIKDVFLNKRKRQTRTTLYPRNKLKGGGGETSQTLDCLAQLGKIKSWLFSFRGVSEVYFFFCGQCKVCMFFFSFVVSLWELLNEME